MLGFLSSLIGGGLLGTVEKIATEVIQTDRETAEAKALFVKTLDPNGMMRRGLSRFACIAYGFYLFVMSVLLLMVSFGFGDATGAELASSLMTDLFSEITTAWSLIVAASFGVNGMNSYKGR